MVCDLHMHSTASDGTDAPEALPALVRDAGLEAFALTDHDTTAGLTACAEAAAAIDLPFAPGIELSADPSALVPEPDAADRITLHILGYFIDADDAQLESTQQWLRDARAQRNPAIIEKLRELGVRISEEEVRAAAGGEIIGRPHIAQVLVKKGYVKSMHAAFTRYLGQGAAAHVPKARLSPAAAIEAIRHAGGVAVLAHPIQLRLPDAAALEHVVARLVDFGLEGIETRHSDHRPADVERYETLARRFRLLTTGGSDYHGDRKDVPLGEPAVEMACFTALRDRAARDVTDTRGTGRR